MTYFDFDEREREKEKERERERERAGLLIHCEYSNPFRGQIKLLTIIQIIVEELTKYI